MKLTVLRMERAMILTTFLLILASAPADPATEAVTAPAASASTKVVVAGPEYKAGGMHRMLFGTDYRDTWTTPVRVEVLDLGSYAGGLKATKKGGGKQTKSLTFTAADGREFKFRSVDKDPSAALPEELRDTPAEWIAQDQIRAAYPVAAVVVDPLAEAAGLLYVPHHVYVLPDDARLGEFRPEFKGLLGILEENPEPHAALPPGFEGAADIVETEDLLKKLAADPRERIDERTYLRTRLLDMLIGDWDRHESQWEWVRKDDARVWVPFATDRDQALSDYDGLLLGLARGRLPNLVVFEEQYPKVKGLVWHARDVDRRFLGGVERAAYAEEAASLQRAITDEAIARAVNALPPEYLKLDGGRLNQVLKARRDRLPEIAMKFYDLLAREPEIHLSDAAETVDVDRSERGDSLEVTVRANGGDATFRRRFLESETRDIRIYAAGGDDRLASHGTGAGGITVRFVGGPGDDTVDDSQGRGTHFYDSAGSNRTIDGPGTTDSDKPYERTKDSRGYYLVDWGSSGGLSPYVSAGGDVGVIFGAQMQWIHYGFRKYPWASRQVLRGGYAFGVQGFRFEYDGQRQHTNSRKREGLFARASNIEVVRFYGFGNQTTATAESSDFYRSHQRQYLIQPAFRFGLDKVELWVGARGKFQHTDENADTFVATARPYGIGDFGQVGANMRFIVDTRNHVVGATRGVHFAAEGNYYPKAWDVAEAFGEANGELGAHLHFLHLRAGGKKLWGRYPFYEAAFLGGPDTVRGLRRQRYAGDAMVFGNAELRVPLFTFNALVPVRVGLLGLADIGRVYFEGESSDMWHKAYGGGAWFSFLKPENTLSLTAAKDPDGTGHDAGWRVYFQAGFAF
jgi:hypothetical protein